MKAIHMPSLRFKLFGKDVLPIFQEEKFYGDVALTDYNGDLQATMDLVLIPQGPSPGKHLHIDKYKHRSAHRLLAMCPCGKRVPVGRLAQHRH